VINNLPRKEKNPAAYTTTRSRLNPMVQPIPKTATKLPVPKTAHDSPPEGRLMPRLNLLRRRENVKPRPGVPNPLDPWPVILFPVFGKQNPSHHRRGNPFADKQNDTHCFQVSSLKFQVSRCLHPFLYGGTKGGFFSFRRAGLSLRNPAGIGTPRDRILLQQHHRNKSAPASYTIPCNSGFGLPIFCVKKKQAPFGQGACFRPEGLARVAVRGYFMRTMRPA